MNPDPEQANNSSGTPQGSPADAGPQPVAPVGEVPPAEEQDQPDGLRAKVRQTGEAATGRIGEQAKSAMRDAQEKTAQAKEKLGDLASRARENAPAVDSGTATRGAGIGAAVLGASAAVLIWIWRRRARRNAGPWKTAGAQVRAARKQAKAGLKTARKRSRARAASQVASAKAKARAAKAKAKARR